MAGLRQSEIRDKVQAYFKAQLDQYLDWLDRRGLSKNALEDVRCEMLDQESYLDMEMESDQYLPVKPFLRKSGLTAQDWQDSQPMMQRELRKGRRDLLRAVLEAAERLEHYSNDNAPAIAPAAPAPALPSSSPVYEIEFKTDTLTLAPQRLSDGLAEGTP